MDDNGNPILDDRFRPRTLVDKKLEEMEKAEAGGRERIMGDRDVWLANPAPDFVVNDASTATTGPVTIEVNTRYIPEQSDPPNRKHCFSYTIRITNNSETDTIQMVSRKFFIQTIMSKKTDIVEGEGITGKQPVIKPGESFEYTSTAPLSCRALGSTSIAARMRGEYRYCILKEGQETATEEQINKGKGEAMAELASFHFKFPDDVRPQKWWSDEEDLDDDDDEEPVELPPHLEKYRRDPIKLEEGRPLPTSPEAKAATGQPATSSGQPAASSPPPVPKSLANTLPGDPDITSGNISGTPNDSSDTVTSDVRVVVTSKFLPERSDTDKSKYCFAYNVRISNESKTQAIQLVSRRFEIQNIGSQTKDVVQGANVTGRQPVLKPGENFEYTSTAPLSVRPMLDKTRVLSRMSGEYNCVLLADDCVTPLSSTPLKAELGTMHFILPEN